MIRQKIAQSQAFRFSCFMHFFHSAPCQYISFFPVSFFQRCFRPVNQIHIYIIHLKTFQTSIHSRLHLIVSSFINPGFRCNKEFFPWNTAFSDCLSQNTFCFIKRCCIKITVSCFDGCFDNLQIISTFGIICTKAKAWNLCTVFQCIAVID